MKVALVFLLFAGVFLTMTAVAHEQVHKIIFEDYGISSHIEYFSSFPDFVTVPDSNGTCPYECKLAHNINEAVTYPLVWVELIIIAGLFFIIILLEEKR